MCQSKKSAAGRSDLEGLLLKRLPAMLDEADKLVAGMVPTE
jgi:hypothetical protein